MIANGRAHGNYRVVPLPRFGQGGRWRTEAMRSYSQPVLLWFTKGHGRITVSGVTRGYGAHNAVFLPPGTMHGFEMFGQVFGWIVYFPNDPELGLPSEPAHLRFRGSQQQTELTALVENIARETERDLPGQSRALAYHGGLLSVWLERQLDLAGEDAVSRDASRRLAAAFAALVERDFHTGRPVSSYAAELGVTPTHLSRVCNQASGRPASKIVADRVHFEARRLLRDTRLPVQEIARTLGFHSPAYFTRAFQKQTGQTPTGFRRNH